MKPTILTKQILIIATLMMALSVIIGAFGAHGLKTYLNEDLMKIFQTAVSYQFYNTLSFFALAFISTLLTNNLKLKLAFYGILTGTLIFSFSLYALVLLNLPILGAITPIGGSLLVLSWLFLSFILIKDLKLDSNS